MAFWRAPPISANTPGCECGCIPAVLLPLGKARRLKQAKEEAQMEVEQYRREREQEFQSKQQAVSCGWGKGGGQGWSGELRGLRDGPSRVQIGGCLL